MNTLPKVVTRRKKRVGRGYGSGKGGHTAGRGTKGQKSRSKVGIMFEGVKMKKSLIKRLPLRRGKGKFKAKTGAIIIKLNYLNVFPTGSKVNFETLTKHGVLKKDLPRNTKIKILNAGELKKKLSVEVPISKNAAKAVKKAGGKVAK